MKNSHPFHQKVVVGPFQCNCHLIVCSQTGHGVLIDTGDDAEAILDLIKKVEAQRPHDATWSKVQIKKLIHTHAHLDHIGATRKVKEGLIEQAGEPGASVAPKIVLHKADLDLYQKLPFQGQMFNLQYDAPLPVDQYIEHEERIEVGELKFDVIHTPGHSPGGVCLRLKQDSSRNLAESIFSGDTLFQGSIGRTDLWGGDHGTLIHTIKDRLLTLDGDIRVCPGHGPDTSIGVEKTTNPFFV